MKKVHMLHSIQNSKNGTKAPYLAGVFTHGIVKSNTEQRDSYENKVNPNNHFTQEQKQKHTNIKLQKQILPGVILSITVSARRPGGVNSVCPTSVSRKATLLCLKMIPTVQNSMNQEVPHALNFSQVTM